MDVPLSILILLCILFLIIGAVLILLLQYYVYLKFSMLPEETDEQRDINVKYTLPSALRQSARGLNATTAANSSTPSSGRPSLGESAESGSLVSVNFVMQFLFHELRNSNRVRKWFYRKLSVELDELIAKTTTGKLFDKLTIKELELGDQFPEIKTLRVHNVQLDETEVRIENLDLLLGINYNGNFRTTIDADMVLGKKGSLTLKVKQLSGLARLQFTRNPYTHWSLSFLGDPEIDLAIESKYQGRQMQSNITSLISNQIRKAVRRKHTLPNYKLRYKPFFHKTPEDDAGDGDIQPNGFMEIKVSEMSRLMCPLHITDIYCTLTMASLAFVEARQRDDRNVVVSLDVEIHKAKNQQIGIFFKQSSEQIVEIEAVLPNTPACKSNLRVGDVLLAIEGRQVNTIQQITKVVKALHNPVFRLRIERIIPGIIRNDAILEDLELYEDFGDRQRGYGRGKNLEPELAIKSRTSSAERGTSSESSLSNTPTNSPKKTKLIAKALKKTISRDNNEHSQDEMKSKIKLPIKDDDKLKFVTKSSLGGDGIHDVEHYYQHSTIDCPMAKFIQMEDLSNFKLGNQCRYLNVCVYGKCIGESLLLGFVNIPIQQILMECCETSLTHYWKRFDLNPPIPQDLKTHSLSSQSGFNANLCFGDILLAFRWDGNPNMTVTETPSKLTGKTKISTTTERSSNDDSACETISIKSSSSDASASITSMPRAHNFIRTHFQRATQCDFCGKKIWLKDAVQCRECLMCCHKKCVNKCQMSTVCGPVDCSIAMSPQSVPVMTTITATPEFTVTEPTKAMEATEYDDLSGGAFSNVSDDELLQAKSPTTANLEVHRSSLTGLLAQGMKRVNSANNLAISGIVTSLTVGVGGSSGGGANFTGQGISQSTKSLPPTPQSSPMRKCSIVGSSTTSPFDVVTQRLDDLPIGLSTLTAEQVALLTEPILSISKDEDVMTLAKTASQILYTNLNNTERVEHINQLLTKLRLALDSETSIHDTLATSSKQSEQTDISGHSGALDRSEERIQALSVIMLYLCTGLQHAQGVALH